MVKTKVIISNDGGCCTISNEILTTPKRTTDLMVLYGQVEDALKGLSVSPYKLYRISVTLDFNGDIVTKESLIRFGDGTFRDYTIRLYQTIFSVITSVFDWYSLASFTYHS